MKSQKMLRTVKVTTENGLGAEIEFGYQIKQFKCKNGCEHHNHLVCADCGHYLYIESEHLENLQDKLCKEQGFLPAKHSFKLFGLCRKCSRQ